jgi:hypothetical protein
MGRYYSNELYESKLWGCGLDLSCSGSGGLFWARVHKEDVVNCLSNWETVTFAIRNVVQGVGEVSWVTERSVLPPELTAVVRSDYSPAEWSGGRRVRSSLDWLRKLTVSLCCRWKLSKLHTITIRVLAFLARSGVGIPHTTERRHATVLPRTLWYTDFRLLVRSLPNIKGWCKIIFF